MSRSNSVTSHLTEDVLNDVLIGIGSDESAVHLASCGVCHAKLEGFRVSVGMFNEAMTAWSEAKSNALSRDLSQHHIPFRISSGVAWTCASILVLALTGTASVSLRHPSRGLLASGTHAAEVVGQGSSAEREDEIASDNALLKQIDSEISTPEPSPVDVYGDFTGTNSRRMARQIQVRD